MHVSPFRHAELTLGDAVPYQLLSVADHTDNVPKDAIKSEETYPLQRLAKLDNPLQYAPVPPPFAGSLYTIPCLSSLPMSYVGPTYTTGMLFSLHI